MVVHFVLARTDSQRELGLCAFGDAAQFVYIGFYGDVGDAHRLSGWDEVKAAFGAAEQFTADAYLQFTPVFRLIVVKFKTVDVFYTTRA